MFETEWHSEKIDRHLLASQVTPYGVSFLDDALVGIFPNDLIVLGAKTGRGKTELMTIFALNQSSLGRKVTFFALEADRWEIQRRIKYKQIVKTFVENGLDKQIPIPRFVEWLASGFDADMEKIEQILERDIAVKTSDLRIVYTESRYSLKQFIESLEGAVDDTDLFIIDHLHYFDVGSKNESEGIKEIIHTIRDFSIKQSKPVILISHLRKTEKKVLSPIPDLDDFHGHSDISKVCTTAIIIAPAEIPEIASNNAYLTYFHIAKARKASENIPYVGILGYDKATGNYRDIYYVAKNRLIEGPELIKNAKDIPKWFKRAHRNYNLAGAPVDYSKTDMF